MRVMRGTRSSLIYACLEHALSTVMTSKNHPGSISAHIDRIIWNTEYRDCWVGYRLQGPKLSVWFTADDLRLRRPRILRHGPWLR
jgi:hypothetical protein